ncbi:MULTISPECIES: aminoglycoside phosphotransferase family protein [Paenibacillus]|uniref:aminoglycoside phosphotransferase family protein n=1 Tax=Paenibacillus TaxID=44249 RepID=UPI000364DB22|nr:MULTISPECIES: aminoglycoside phosphotransferase family protein [Paenibacillus]
MLYFGQIEWKRYSETMDQLLLEQEQGILRTSPLHPGFEAQVVLLGTSTGQYVFKHWNQSSRPNVELQYDLLEQLHQQHTGIPVPVPVAYGTDPEGHDILITSYNGMPVNKLSTRDTARLAAALADLHKLEPARLHQVGLPLYDPVQYFFQQLDQHSDISECLSRIPIDSLMRQDRIIHADYHLNNIVMLDQHYTIIDWTNVQLGDARIDLAWSLLILELYVSGRYAAVFRKAYLNINPSAEEELESFTAFCILRWALQYRMNNAPRHPGVLKKASTLIAANPWLQQNEFLIDV